MNFSTFSSIDQNIWFFWRDFKCKFIFHCGSKFYYLYYSFVHCNMPNMQIVFNHFFPYERFIFVERIDNFELVMFSFIRPNWRKWFQFWWNVNILVVVVWAKTWCILIAHKEKIDKYLNYLKKKHIILFSEEYKNSLCIKNFWRE